MSERTKFLHARWENLIMANYAVDPSVLLPYLPNGLDIDYYSGKCFVSLVGFMFKNSRIFGMPIPFLGSFEEVNLRFYVTRKVGNEVKRGVVFLNETVPFRIVAWLANALYYECYRAVPTLHKLGFKDGGKDIQYMWKQENEWYSIGVQASNKTAPIASGSMEEFIFEHYYGYSKISQTKTLEYRVNHPIWQVNEVKDYNINCSFGKMYGDDFNFLNTQNPDSVFLATGSQVSIDWKKERFQAGKWMECLNLPS